MALDLGRREQGCPSVRWCHHLCSDVDSLDGSAGGVVWPGEDEPVRVEGDASFRLGRVWLDASLHRVAARDWSGRAHLDARVARIRFREDVGKVCACVRVEVSRDLTCCHVGAVGLRVIRQPERVEVQELRLCVVEDAAHPAAQLDNRIRGVLPQLDELLRELRHNVRIRRSASVVQRHAVVADTVHDVSGADNIDVARYPHACGRVVGRVHHEPRGACLGEEVRGGLGGVGDVAAGRHVRLERAVVLTLVDGQSELASERAVGKEPRAPVEEPRHARRVARVQAGHGLVCHPAASRDDDGAGR